MNQENVKALSDTELVNFITLAQAEQKTRAEKRKQETIDKIKNLARSADLTIEIKGMRGRPIKHHSRILPLKPRDETYKGQVNGEEKSST